MDMDRDLLDLYKETFATWRFQIESYWNRNTYFGTFETAAITADWLVGGEHHWTAFVGSVGGLVLTMVWMLNCLKQHAYVRFWWAKLIEYDGQYAAEWAAMCGSGTPTRRVPILLASDFDRWRAARGRESLVRYDYSNLVLLVPVIFLGLWSYLGIFHLRHLQQLGWPVFGS